MSTNTVIVILLGIVLLVLGIFVGRGLKNSPLSYIVPTSPPSQITVSSPTASPLPAKASSIKIFVIAINDNGKLGPKIGCGDSVVAVQRKITPTQAPLRAALNELLSIKTQFLGQSGLYNSLYQSNLKIDDLSINSQGKATVKLSGNLILGGICDSPRVEAQLTQTVLQFSTVKEAEISINNKSLKEVLSQK